MVSLLPTVNKFELPPLSAILNESPLRNQLGHERTRSTSRPGSPLMSHQLSPASISRKDVHTLPPFGPLDSNVVAMQGKPDPTFGTPVFSRVTNPSFQHTPESISVPKTLSVTSLDSSAKKTPQNTKLFAFISHSPETFPLQEPTIDNAQLARRKRRRTSPAELFILKEEFSKGSTPNRARRKEISRRVNMTDKAVQVWFQNRRQSMRKHNQAKQEILLDPVIPQPISQQLHFTTSPLRSNSYFTDSDNGQVHNSIPNSDQSQSPSHFPPQGTWLNTSAVVSTPIKQLISRSSITNDFGSTMTFRLQATGPRPRKSSSPFSSGSGSANRNLVHVSERMDAEFLNKPIMKVSQQNFDFKRGLDNAKTPSKQLVLQDKSRSELNKSNSAPSIKISRDEDEECVKQLLSLHSS
ncbi:Homeobox transcriptional repressor [Komagataella phaffii CBS 7435]|uniref:Homeodomain-containing transcriptional repressor n=2 Tax=Komagataella phaffii TaxID=460519 RepID=C4R1R8_KOMPG|nr:Homeodomain-containing transcriptional repressor [Komagataella phaffii GS115]AOA62543.1 GQ67_00858T0 [Komagataella phaffii]CAH2448019.1 Homeobox transcriptional repressor [Komagataella phaffii CBS 7435]AOA67376.1 GQ68_00531T0 [Komagataella phaffii GS115]CAY69442.1 Homeodomain-containing transcriptional repressor [Komagataella phaffii GS115]CCA38173.1 Homeobox transcriptional repressor [Komagataella phaffii CBS 7435]